MVNSPSSTPPKSRRSPRPRAPRGARLPGDRVRRWSLTARAAARLAKTELPVTGSVVRSCVGARADRAVLELLPCLVLDSDEGHLVDGVDHEHAAGSQHTRHPASTRRPRPESEVPERRPHVDHAVERLSSQGSSRISPWRQSIRAARATRARCDRGRRRRSRAPREGRRCARSRTRGRAPRSSSRCDATAASARSARGLSTSRAGSTRPSRRTTRTSVGRPSRP